jgi:hypothetical protein
MAKKPNVARKRSSAKALSLSRHEKPSRDAAKKVWALLEQQRNLEQSLVDVKTQIDWLVRIGF